MAAILVVDDEEDIRELVGIYLKNEGFKVYKAADGQEALKCLDDMQIDLAILDVMMSDMDGIALCLEIRKKSNIPIIMLSCLLYTSCLLIIYGRQEQSRKWRKL